MEGGCSLTRKGKMFSKNKRTERDSERPAPRGSGEPRKKGVAGKRGGQQEEKKVPSFLVREGGAIEGNTKGIPETIMREINLE